MSFIKITFFLSVFLFSTILFSCSDDDPVTTPSEYVANDASFSNWMSWTLVATISEPGVALGEMAHGGQDPTFTRKVYIKDNATAVNGKYPVGTIVVKHSQNEANTTNEYTAMVKRGNGFNPSNNDWEWFMIDTEGKIADGGAARGANLMNGMCGGCHTGATAKDFVFSK